MITPLYKRIMKHRHRVSYVYFCIIPYLYILYGMYKNWLENVASYTSTENMIGTMDNEMDSITIESRIEYEIRRIVLLNDNCKLLGSIDE